MLNTYWTKTKLLVDYENSVHKCVYKKEAEKHNRKKKNVIETGLSGNMTEEKLAKVQQKKTIRMLSFYVQSLHAMNEFQLQGIHSAQKKLLIVRFPSVFFFFFWFTSIPC